MRALWPAFVARGKSDPLACSLRRGWRGAAASHQQWIASHVEIPSLPGIVERRQLVGSTSAEPVYADRRATGTRKLGPTGHSRPRRADPSHANGPGFRHRGGRRRLRRQVRLRFARRGPLCAPDLRDRISQSRGHRAPDRWAPAASDDPAPATTPAARDRRALDGPPNCQVAGNVLDDIGTHS